jgi:hypothetical protein
MGRLASVQEPAVAVMRAPALPLAGRVQRWGAMRSFQFSPFVVFVAPWNGLIAFKRTCWQNLW